MSEEQLDTFSTMDPWDMIDLDADVSNNQPPQPQPDSKNMVEQCAIDVGGNQPPQLPSRPQPQSLPQPKPQPDVREITDQFFTDTCGYQPHQSHPQFDMVVAECLPEAMQPRPQPQPQPQQFLTGVCGYQPPWSQPQQFLAACGYQPPWSQPRPQPQPHPHPQQFLAAVCRYQPPESQPRPQPHPQVWTLEENKAFESVIANCYQDAIHNRWELVAARLPGKTPAQVQERFQKLMNDINVIHNGYTANPPLNAASENMTMTMAAPATIINAPPPPPPYNTDHQHHRAEVVAAAAEKTAPMEAATREQNQSAKKYSRWTEDEHRLFVRGYQEEGSNWSRISQYYVKTRTYHQIVSHAQKHSIRRKRLAKGEKLRKSIFDVI